MVATGKFGEEATKAGVLLESGGLAPSAMRTRLRLASGKLSVIDGPFTAPELRRRAS